MELPIEVLKMVSEFIPVEGQKNHHLIWTPDNGFILFIWVGEKAYRMSFNYDDNINSIKEELQNLTRIPMPEQEKKEEKIMDTPKLSEIRKKAYGTLGTTQGQAALQSALGPSQRAVSNVAPPGTKTRTQVQFMLSPQYHKATKRTAGRPVALKRVLRGMVAGPRKAKVGY